MDDSQDFRAPAPSWPPGTLTGSMVRDNGARRDGLTLISLAVCAYCLGFSVTDWACASRDPAAVVARAKPGLIARQQTQRAAPTGGRAPEPEPVVSVPTVVPKSEAPARAVARGQTPRRAAEPSEIPAALAEPTPVLTSDELIRALALADASQRIFASLDEVGPKPVAVKPAPAVAPAHKRATPRATMVRIEGLSVAGGVPTTVVQRSVQRLLPRYDLCREHSDPPQSVELSATIDEAGHGRRVAALGVSRADLRRCLERATARLVVPAPDTGTARATWVVRFAER